MATVPASLGFEHMHLLTSPDGLHWRSRLNGSGPLLDRSTFWYDSFRRKWIFSLKQVGASWVHACIALHSCGKQLRWLLLLPPLLILRSSRLQAPRCGMIVVQNPTAVSISGGTG
eukprot:SAG22_NODE_180_length_16069_cov_5.323231_2_plen_115_part_00